MKITLTCSCGASVSYDGVGNERHALGHFLKQHAVPDHVIKRVRGADRADLRLRIQHNDPRAIL